MKKSKQMIKLEARIVELEARLLSRDVELVRLRAEARAKLYAP
jgi:hypothetical protein